MREPGPHDRPGGNGSGGEDRDPVAAVLASAPAPDVSPHFLARVNARIDANASSGWFALADFRIWTLRLAPAAAALALIAALWRTPAAVDTASTPAERFTPSSASDWQQDVAANALLEAALAGGPDGR